MASRQQKSGVRNDYVHDKPDLISTLQRDCRQ